MTLKAMKQFGLFQGPENVKTEDGKLKEQEALKEELRQATLPHPLTLPELRRKILSGFLTLHFHEDPEKLLTRPLEILGGKTLESLCIENYSQAYAWTQEYRLHPEEKHLLIAPYRTDRKKKPL